MCFGTYSVGDAIAELHKQIQLANPYQRLHVDTAFTISTQLESIFNDGLAKIVRSEKGAVCVPGANKISVNGHLYEAPLITIKTYEDYCKGSPPGFTMIEQFGQQPIASQDAVTIYTFRGKHARP